MSKKKENRNTTSFPMYQKIHYYNMKLFIVYDFDLYYIQLETLTNLVFDIKITS